MVMPRMASKETRVISKPLLIDVFLILSKFENKIHFLRVILPKNHQEKNHFAQISFLPLELARVASSRDMGG